MGQTVQKLEIRNFKGIGDLEVNLQGKSVFLVAKNGGGKTTFIDAAFAAVKGIEEPLKEGEKRGHVNVTIDDYICEFKFTEKNQKPKLNIYDKSGQPQKSPAALLQKLFGIQDFKIDEFLGQTPKKKVEFIKNILGINWEDMDAKYKKLYDERTFINRKIKENDAKKSGAPLVSNAEKIDVSEVLQEIQEANKLNDNIKKVKTGIEEKRRLLEDLKIQIEKIENDISNGEKWLIGKEEKDISPLNEKLNNAEEHNQKVLDYERHLEVVNESKKLIKEVDDIQDKMDEIDAIKRSELECAEMPARGLSFEDDQLYLDGLPFESNQINTARRIIAGLEIQYALKGEVSIARLEGSLLDKDSLDEVMNWAKERGVQLFVEKVDFDGDELKVEVIES